MQTLEQGRQTEAEQRLRRADRERPLIGGNAVLKAFDLLHCSKHLVHIRNQRLARLCQNHAPPAFLKKRYPRQLFQLRDVERDRRRRIAEEARRLCKATRAHDCPERREYLQFHSYHSLSAI